MEYGWVERMRGIDKWPVADAVAISARQIIKGNRRGDGAWRTICFGYRCEYGDFRGRLFVDSYSSLYELAVGDRFEIQYNPRSPHRYFCQEAKSVFVSLGAVIGLMFLSIILYAVADEVFSH